MATKQRLKRLGKKFGREEKIIDAHCIDPNTGETHWRYLLTHHKDGRITSRELVEEGEEAADAKQPSGGDAGGAAQAARRRAAGRGD